MIGLRSAVAGSIRTPVIVMVEQCADKAYVIQTVLAHDAALGMITK